MIETILPADKKACSKCKAIKLSSEFSPDGRKIDGLQSQCNKCRVLGRDPERHRLASKRYWTKNLEICRKAIEEYRQKDPERYRVRMRKWAKKNRQKINAHAAKYRADRYQRTPPWADIEVIKSIYLNCPSGLQVDHIVPLRGKNVSGLHVSWNLQYLTPEENFLKLNKHSSDGNYND